MKKFLAALLLLIASMCTPPAYALTPQNRELEKTPAPIATVVELYAEAITLSGNVDFCFGRGGCELPEVVLESPESTNIYGWFNWHHAKRVSISTNIPVGSVQWQSIVVHELVHYLQWLKGELHPSTSCNKIGDAEIEAYDVTAAFLKKKFNITQDFAEQKFWMKARCQGQ